MSTIATTVVIPTTNAGVRLTGRQARPVIHITGITPDLSIEQADTLVRSLTLALATARAIEEL